MPNMNLPHGLRYVLAYVSLGTVFPPAANSASDIALLRAANCAMQRKVQGVEDAFLFVVVGRYTKEAVNEIISAYGFPKTTVVCIEPDDLCGDMVDDVILSDIASAIEKWLNNEHIGALAAFPNDYAETDFWWSGVEHDNNVFDWPFSDEDFAKALPRSHYDKAATWLSILGHAVRLDAIQSTSPDALGHDIAAAWAATLCEWLHGFEAASGNGYNHFESDYSAELMPSDFYLGFELARLSGGNLEFVCSEADVDVNDLSSRALKAITEERRGGFRTALSDFFGSDCTLYWALHSVIWPCFSKSMSEALELELGSTNFEDLARHEAPWRFVSEGWCEKAYE